MYNNWYFNKLTGRICCSRFSVERLAIFDFLLPASIGVIYLWLVAQHIVSERKTPLAGGSPRIYLAQLHILGESKSVGKTLSELIKLTSGAMKVERIQRGKETHLSLLQDVEIKSGD